MSTGRKIYFSVVALVYGLMGLAYGAYAMEMRGRRLGKDEARKEIDGLKLAVETLSKRQQPIIVGDMELVPEPVHLEPVAKLVVSNH